MKIFYYLSFSIMLMLSSTSLRAQTISGKVIDAETNEPVIGAAVIEVGTTNGAITDAEGKFNIELKKSPSQIKVSFLGYEAKIVNVEGGETDITVNLSPDLFGLEDVVVTANRVEENLQDLTGAASVVTRKSLEQRSVQTTTEALGSVPNLITDSYGPSLTNISIRGLSTNFDGVGLEQAVGMYVNDVYQSRAYGFNATIMDVDRIEVLRGPQGTLFGKNTVGGVVNIITAQPDMSTEGAVELSAGNFNYFQARAMANVELIENKLAWRITGATTNRKASFVDHQLPEGQAANETKFWGFRSSLLYKPNDNVDVTLDVYYNKDNSAEAAMAYLSDPGLIAIDPVLFAPDDWENRKTSFSEPFTFEREQFGVSGKVIAGMGNGTFSSITAYTQSEDMSIQDVELSVIPAVYLDRLQKFGTFSQEFRYNSNQNKPFSYITGLYFVNEKITGRDIGVTQEFLPPLLGPDLGIDDLFIPGYTESVTNNSNIDNTSIAAFGSFTYKFNDKLSANGGLRFTSENKTFTTQQTTVESQDAIDAVGFPLVYLLGTPYDEVKFDAQDNVLTGDLSLSYKVSGKSLLYGKFARGFKGTGFNFNVATYLNTDTFVFNPVEEKNVLYKPEFINSFEIGFKSSLSDKVRLNLAAYYMDYKDKQELLFEDLSFVIANAARSQGQGFEAELSALLVKGFQIDATAGIQRMEYKEFEFDGLDLSGNKLAKAPDYNFSISPQYGKLFNNGSRFTARVDITSFGKSYNDIFNTESISRQSTTLVNARIGYSIKNGRYNISVWGKNLTDQLYFGHGFVGLIGDFVSMNQARTYGADLRINIF